MPEFNAGELKTAKATMRNPTGKAFSYTAALIVGVPEAARSEASFSIPAGEEKVISFPLAMPSLAGTYPVHVYVVSEGKEVGLHRAVEDVTIVIPALPFTYSFSCVRKTCPSAPAYGIAEMSGTIKNNHSVKVTQNIRVMWSRWSKTYGKWVSCAGQLVTSREYCVCSLSPCKVNPFSLTLNPGETFTFSYAGYCSGVDPRDPTWTPCVPSLMANYNYYFWLEDDGGGKSTEVVLST